MTVMLSSSAASGGGQPSSSSRTESLRSLSGLPPQPRTLSAATLPTNLSRLATTPAQGAIPTDRTATFSSGYHLVERRLVRSVWKRELDEALEAENDDALRALARGGVGRVIRHLSGRLYSGNTEDKWRAVRAFGVLLGDTSIVDEPRAADLLRRFAWALNDESGAVPYGVPEAMGEALAVRPELQEAFLPILCSLLTEDDMSQTGEVERGALWALGRVGPAAMACSPEAVAAVRAAAAAHPEPETRRIAARSLEQMGT